MNEYAGKLKPSLHWHQQTIVTVSRTNLSRCHTDDTLVRHTHIHHCVAPWW